MAVVLAGLAARALWTSGEALRPLPPHETRRAMALSRCSAQQIKRLRSSTLFKAVEGCVRAARASRAAGTGPEDVGPVTLDVVVDDVAKSHAVAHTRRICARAGLPEGSLAAVRGHEGLFVLLPAQHFVTVARDLDVVGCALVATELCGSYLLRPDLAEGFLRLGGPLTTPEALAAQLDKNPRAPGSARAREALGSVCGGSASPMESAVTLLLVLPGRHGGFGLPLPLLNRELPVSAAGVRLLDGRLHVRPDIYWPEARLDLEYDSAAHHTGAEAEYDRLRRTALQTAGVEPVSITPRVVGDAGAFAEVAALVAERLGVRAAAPDPAVHGALRARLLGPHPVW